MKRFIIVSDIHGNQQDERAANAAIAFTKEFKPEIRVIAGDLWDFAAIRHGASPEDRALSMADDFEAGCSFAKRFFAGGKENHLMYGNHDIRALEMAQSSDGVKRDLGDRMVKDMRALATACRAATYPYDARYGVMTIGHLSVVHGFHTGAAAAATHARIYGNVVYGHAHSIESWQSPGLHQREARCIGCLCKLDMDYAATKTGKLRWANGWAYGWVFPDGTYHINQVRGINGRFIAPTGLKEF